MGWDVTVVTVRLGIEITRDSFGLNIVEYMGPQVVLGEIPILVRYIDALRCVCLPKSEVSSQKTMDYVNSTLISVLKMSRASRPAARVWLVCNSNAVYKSYST